MKTNPRVAVFGAGANGGAIAASLFDAGIDVTAIDPWPAHVEVALSRGLTVRKTDEERVTHLPFLHLCQLAEVRGQFDIIVLGVKAYDTRWACELLKPYLADSGTIVAVQNGLTLDVVSGVFGPHRSVGCVIEVASNMFIPGEINQQAPMWLAVGGETAESSERAHDLAPLLAPAASVDVVEDIRSAKWMKLVANACELVPSAILDLPLAKAIELSGMYDVMVAAGHEALDAALRAGHQIVQIFDRNIDSDHLSRDRYVEYLLGAVLEDYTFPDTLTTVLQDWRKGRRAEIEEINGTVVGELGQEGAPMNARILDLARRIEAGQVTAGLWNRDLLVGV